MQHQALVVIDIQNDITKNYRAIIDNLNEAVEWAVAHDIPVVYIKQEYTAETMRKFKPGTRGIELVDELKVVSDNVFIKHKSNVLSSEAFVDFIETNSIEEFFITGADALVCVKSSVYNLTKAGYKVTVLSDCITSWDLSQIGEMLGYYASKGCAVSTIKELVARS